MKPKKIAWTFVVVMIAQLLLVVGQNQAIRILEARLEDEEAKLQQGKERLQELRQEIEALEAELLKLRESRQRVEYIAAQVAGFNPRLDRRLAAQVAVQILESSSRHRVPVDLVLKVGAQESDWRLDARGRHGEYGPLQVLPETFRLMGGSDPRDWRQTLDAGVRYLAKALQLSGGNVQLALARYNSGVNRDAKDALRISGRYAKAVLARGGAR